MDQSLILETTFLIDLERERNGRSQDRFKRCSVFLKRHATYRLFMTDIIAGELASGVCPHDHAKWEEFINPFRILPMSPRVSWEYGETYRYLKANSMLIGSNDLWIGAVGLAYEVPVVTHNVEHFRRIPRLQVISY